jgi:hypothetical protein
LDIHEDADGGIFARLGWSLFLTTRSTSAMTPARGSMRSMKRIQPRPVAAVKGARIRRAWKLLE